MNPKPVCFFPSLLFLLLQAALAHAQTIPFYTTVFRVLEDTSRSLPVQKVWQRYGAGGFTTLQEPALAPRFTTAVFWLAIAAKDLPVAHDLQLVADNAHINRLE